MMPPLKKWVLSRLCETTLEARQVLVAERRWWRLPESERDISQVRFWKKRGGIRRESWAMSLAFWVLITSRSRPLYVFLAPLGAALLFIFGILMALKNLIVG